MINISLAPYGRMVLICCFSISICCFGAKSLLAATTQDKRAPDLQLSWVDDGSFVYQREGRPDPFTPFIPEKLVAVPVDQKELTGMRRFEPGQLALVSIVTTEQGPLAMVQDSSGKGYIIRKGSKIGRSGVVSDIITNKVEIQQQMLTATGEKRTQTVEMVLRKEGEK